MLSCFQEIGNMAQEIVPRVYLGSLASATNELIKEQGITHILSVGSFANVVDAVGTTNRMTIEVVDDDKEDIYKHFDACTDFISTALATKEHKVLVHCHYGVSRSATILAAYLIRAEGMKLEEAVRIIRAKRLFIKPNDGFVLQLQRYEKITEKVTKAIDGLLLESLSLDN